MPAHAAAVPAPTAPPLSGAHAPATRSVSREEIVRAAGGSPWTFLPVALQVLRQRPDDHEIRFLTAAAFARLMLVTPAREQLDLLPAEQRQGAAARAMRAAIDVLPTDHVGVDALECMLLGNLDALAKRRDDPVDLGGHVAAWRSGAAGWDWFRTRDGQIVRRRSGSTDDWRHLADLKGAIARVTLPHAAATGGGGSPRPYVLEGADPPWLVERVLRETPAQPDGYRARITIVHEDPLELLDGLAQTDLRDVLESPRVRIICGPGAGGALIRDLLARLDTQITGPGLSMSTARARITPSVEESLQHAQRAQAEEQQRLLAEVARIYGGRDRAWWAARYAGADAGAGARPLRILIPTCRYSTYIKHASADLAAAFARLGCEARVLIEPDDHSHLSGVAYLRAVAGFEPDLVVLINYARANMNGALHGAGPGAAAAPVIPAQVPYMMWIQDSMPHQLDRRVGESMGELDFVAGNLRTELFLHMAYPRDRALPSPIVASEEKFHDGPCAPALAARHACEIAYVSHHAETPEAMHRRKRGEAAANPALVELIDELRPAVEREALAPPQTRTPLLFRLRAAAGTILRSRGGDDGDETLVSKLLHMYALPMADRMLRHQALEWAAAIAAARGWRMRIHGRGWEAHPTLGALACGELEHGESLRASYGCARAHLHISAHTVIHQRIVECVLSGGLPIGRLSEDDLSSLEFEAAAGAALARGLDASPDACDARTLIRGRYRLLGYHVASHPPAMTYAALRQRCGLEADAFVWLNSAHVEGRLREHRAGEPLLEEEQSIAWLFGDPAEHLFADRATLERLLVRAVDDDAWRAERTAAMQGRIRDRLTHGAFARRLIRFVGDRLGA